MPLYRVADSGCRRDAMHRASLSSISVTDHYVAPFVLALNINAGFAFKTMIVAFLKLNSHIRSGHEQSSKEETQPPDNQAID